MNYDPYGVPSGTVDGFGFTGEMTDANELVYLRARYYDPNIGVFVSLDPFEGVHGRPMSMNGYSWVEGNVANWNDPSGLCPRAEDSPNEAFACELMRFGLANHGVRVVYEDSLSPLMNRQAIGNGVAGRVVQ